jgi:hypothetical protein
MAERIKTLVAEGNDRMREVGKHPEKNTWDLFYLDGVAYRVLSASKFVHNRQREQELRLRRED